MSYYENGDVANLALDVRQRIADRQPAKQTCRAWHASIRARVEQTLWVVHFEAAKLKLGVIGIQANAAAKEAIFALVINFFMQLVELKSEATTITKPEGPRRSSA